MGARSGETLNCLRLLAETKSHSGPPVANVVLKWRGGSDGRAMLSRATARDFAGSLLERPFYGGSDGEIPQVSDVVRGTVMLGLA